MWMVRIEPPNRPNIVPTSVYNWEIPSSFVGNARATFDPGGALDYSLFVENFTSDTGYSGGLMFRPTRTTGDSGLLPAQEHGGFNVRYKF